MIKLITLLVSLFLFPLGVSASAIFDYQSMADDNTDLNYQGEKNLEGIDITVSGITATAYGDYLSAGEGWAYLDAGNAGLGVCHTKNGNCAGSSDDNLTDDEVLQLVFSEIISLDALTLKKGNHGAFADEGIDKKDWFQLSLDGIAYTSYDYSDGDYLGLKSNEFYFKTVTPGNDDDAIYVSSLTATAVPEPSIIALFAAGLFGIGFARRRMHN